MILAARSTSLTLAVVLVAACSANPRPSGVSQPPIADLDAAAVAPDESPSAAAAVALAAEPSTDWMTGAVRIVASDGERDQYGRLKTAGEQREFARLFWQRRDPRLGDEINEYAQEFGRRVSTADTLFGVGEVAGWDTVFGWALIGFGFPNVVRVMPRDADDTGDADSGTEPGFGDRVIWQYGVDVDAMLAAASYGEPGPTTGGRPRNAVPAGPQGASPIFYVDFYHRHNGWFMSCSYGIADITLVRAGTGAAALGRGFGPPQGVRGNEVGLTAEEVPGTGVPTMGRPLTGEGIYSTTPAVFGPRCSVLMRASILSNMLNEVDYPGPAFVDY